MTPGVDLYTVQRAGGWKSQAMVQRDAHLSPDYVRAAVERMAKGQSEGATGTKTGTERIGQRGYEAQVRGNEWRAWRESNPRPTA